MVQLQTRALTTKATENVTLTRRRQSRSTSFSEGFAFTLSCLKDEKVLPVFVFPQELYFYADDAKSLTQEVKVYNPYEWSIKFKFFVTTPKKWEVSDPEGVIKPSHMYEVSIRLLDRSPSLIGSTDYLRVVMQTVTDSIKLGKKDLTCKFLAEKKNEEEEAKQNQRTGPTPTDVDKFLKNSIETTSPTVKKPQEVAAPTAKSASSKSDTQGANKNKSKTKSNWPPTSYVFTAIICGIILCMPTEECILPAYLVISHTPKYIAAYVLVPAIRILPFSLAINFLFTFICYFMDHSVKFTFSSTLESKV